MVALHFRDSPAHILRRPRDQHGQVSPFGGTPFHHTRFVQPLGMVTDEARASTN